MNSFKKAAAKKRRVKHMIARCLDTLLYKHRPTQYQYATFWLSSINNQPIDFDPLPKSVMNKLYTIRYELP